MTTGGPDPARATRRVSPLLSFSFSRRQGSGIFLGGAHARFGTGTGFACAKLSEVLPPVATAPVVRMTEKNARGLRRSGGHLGCSLHRGQFGVADVANLRERYVGDRESRGDRIAEDEIVADTERVVVEHDDARHAALRFRERE